LVVPEDRQLIAYDLEGVLDTVGIKGLSRIDIDDARTPRLRRLGVQFGFTRQAQNEDPVGFGRDCDHGSKSLGAKVTPLASIESRAGLTGGSQERRGECRLDARFVSESGVFLDAPKQIIALHLDGQHSKNREDTAEAGSNNPLSANRRRL
jgi:hypothetical protein